VFIVAVNVLKQNNHTIFSTNLVSPSVISVREMIEELSVIGVEMMFDSLSQMRKLIENNDVIL